MKKYILKAFICVFVAIFSVSAYADVEKKVVLQAFWWDYWNNNYENSFANYLTELAPRLKEMGINAVWVPPFYKNTGTNSVGYSPFDHYDLGDKYQKGSVTTRFGTKDEVLRMIAVMHANGIEVYADIVLNHVDGANVIDPEAYDGQWKNFRYVCYKTPEDTGSDEEYLAREGRWSKNWQNFHANDAHLSNEGNWCSAWWGPDICYYEGAYGQSSNATYNPEQYSNYMRTNAREWLMWFVKQTSVDGFRWDAVKHFPEWAQQDFLYNVKYSLPEWCQGGEEMFSVGEYVGSKSEVDTYTSTVTTSNGGSEFMMGGYDFPLRESIKSIVSGGGYGDLSGIPSAQIDGRYAEYATQKVHRSLNYINSHDTFRPTFDENGNYSGWDTSNETGEHIDPFDSRLGMAYAIAMALDGNVSVYFEDLFNISNSNRWTHDPKSEEELPARSAITNLIWCHQNLNFKYGDYKVRYQSEDLLVIERSGRAIIAITDNGASDQSAWIDTDFTSVELKDYSGGISSTSTVYADGRLYVQVSNVGNGYGYAVWAPAQEGSNYTPYRSTTTMQEWEMADDLGDSNCQSLGQGGALPENSTNQRVVGKIYPEEGTDVSVILYPTTTGNEIMLALYDLDGNVLSKQSGTENVELTWTATYSGWVTMKVWNVSEENIGQIVWVRASYTAPTKITDTQSNSPDTRASIWTGNAGTQDWTDCGNWEQGMTPSTSSKVVIPDNGMLRPVISGDVTIAELVIENGKNSADTPDVSVSGSLTVTGSSSSLENAAYVCGSGTINLGSTSNVSLCTSATDIENTDSDETSLMIYPNPASNVLKIASSSILNQDAVIYDMSLTPLMTIFVDESLEEVDVAALSPGVYIIKIGSQAYKFVKE